MFKDKRYLGFVIAVMFVLSATVIICVCAVACSGGEVNFERTYYFVCYRITDNSVSASSLSNTVSDYGGAGYILNYDGNYYVTVSCYYKENDADAVCESLKKRDLECSVLEIETTSYKVNGFSAKNNSELYLGNFNTLDSLSSIAYECANGLDTGGYSQSNAQEVISSIKNTLKGLLLENTSNCFTDSFNFLIAECEDKERGYIFSKDMRYLQIAIIDIIINAELY